MTDKLSRRGLFRAMLGAASAILAGSRARTAPAAIPAVPVPYAVTSPRSDFTEHGLVTTFVYDAVGRVTSVVDYVYPPAPLHCDTVKGTAETDHPNPGSHSAGCVGSIRKTVESHQSLTIFRRSQPRATGQPSIFTQPRPTNSAVPQLATEPQKEGLEDCLGEPEVRS